MACANHVSLNLQFLQRALSWRARGSCTKCANHRSVGLLKARGWGGGGGLAKSTVETQVRGSNKRGVIEDNTMTVNHQKDLFGGKGGEACKK
jgi:hypothetical protein